MTVTGVSGSITETVTFTLAVSAALGTTGTGTQVNLSSEFNVNGIYTDGTTYSTGGLDGTGYSYSANLLTTSRVYNGTLFDFGPANELDAVGCSGQSVSLTQGKFSSFMLLATGVEGNQTSQTFTVKYTRRNHFENRAKLQRLVHSAKIHRRERRRSHGVPELRQRHQTAHVQSV